MAYQKQNFVDGQTLTAAHLNHMEVGIEEAEKTGGTVSLAIGTVTSGSTASATITDGKLNLVLPKGETGTAGATGATGAKGEKGDDGTGFTDTTKALILSLFESAAYGNASMQSTLDSLRTEWNASSGGSTPTVPVSGISLSQSSLSLTAGSNATLTATVTPSNATNKAVLWSVSPSGYVTVSGGIVTAVKAGSCTITASCGGKTASCAVTVTAAASAPSDDIPGKTPVYKLAQAKTFKAANQEYIDTGIKLFETINPQPSWTILLEVQGGDVSGTPDTYCLLHCMNEATPYPGMSLAIWGGSGDLGLNFYKSSGPLSGLSKLKSQKVRIAIQISEGTFTTRTNSGIGTYTSMEISGYTATVDKSLIIGAYQSSDGVKGRFFDGTVYQLMIFDSALDVNTIESWVSGSTSTPTTPDAPTDTTVDIEGEAPVYKLAQATEFTPSKANFIDTGIKLFETINPQPSWTILLEFSYNASLTSLYKQHAILHCMRESDPYPGIVIKADKSGSLQAVAYGVTLAIDSPASLTQKRRFAFRISGSKIWGWSYNGNAIGNAAGNDFTNYTNVSKPVILGTAQMDDGSKDNFFDGILYKCLMYAKALTDNQIKGWVTG